MINLTLSQVSHLLEAQAYKMDENSDYDDKWHASARLMDLWDECLAVEKQYQDKQIGVGQLRKQIDVLRDAIRVRTQFGDREFLELVEASSKADEWVTVSVTELFQDSKTGALIPFDMVPFNWAPMLQPAGKPTENEA